MKLNLVLLVTLCALAAFPLGAAELKLSTNPPHESINGKRYVFIQKGASVHFSVDPSKTPVTLTWVFDNGDPEQPPGNGPHSIAYGEAAEGKANLVRFSSQRTDENDANCVTTNKTTCRVGSNSWRGDDVGGAIQGYDIDLYYGDADPLSASQVSIPETNPQYSNQNNVSVLLTKIP